jgi:hypothetical protein
LGDLDGDGDLDALVAIASPEGNRIWFNDDGQFQDSGQILGSSDTLSISLGDLDGDGDLDAFEANGSSEGNRIWLNHNPDAPIPAVTLSVDTAMINETADVATITASLSLATTQTVTVHFGFQGTAVKGIDYASSTDQILIPAGSLGGTVTITVVQDLLDEFDETVIVGIRAVTNGIEQGTQRATITIADDDESPVPIVNSVTPLNNSHDAVVSTDISATFNRNVEEGTASPRTFVVHSMQRGQLIGSAASVNALGASLTLDPTIDFFPGELVQATVTSRIESTSGQPATPRVWQLRTSVLSGSGEFRASGQRLGN